MRQMVGDKALALDGFSIAFLQTCWNVIKDEIMEVLHENERFEKSPNITLITLIPQKPSAVEVKDY